MARRPPDFDAVRRALQRPESAARAARPREETDRLSELVREERARDAERRADEDPARRRAAEPDV